MTRSSFTNVNIQHQACEASLLVVPYFLILTFVTLLMFNLPCFTSVFVKCWRLQGGTIITYWLLYKIPNVLRIKWYRPSGNIDSICTIFGHAISPQCQDADLSTNPVLWLSHVSRDISARLDIELRVPTLHTSWNDLSKTV